MADSKAVVEKIRERVRKLETEWIKGAKRIEKIYDSDDSGDGVPFNILYSNTETLTPALYNSTPRPEVMRRWTGAVNIDRFMDEAVSQVSERALTYFADTDEGDKESFSSVVLDAVQGCLVPGLGQARIKLTDDEGHQALQFSSVPYDRFVWGYARKWEQVPWVAFGHDLTKQDFEKQFADWVKANKKDYDAYVWTSEESGGQSGNSNEQRTPTLLVWEHWDPYARKVTFVADGMSDAQLAQDDYPQGMRSRFPCPKPLAFRVKSRGLIPVPPYKFYEYQAEQLNVVTGRLRRVNDAIRVRGVYNNSITAFKQMLEDQDLDNELLPSAEVQGIIDAGGLEKHIWLMPLDMLVKVSETLTQVQMALKLTIFEIMGISDIQRGSSNPNETAEAQQIKNRWGTLRLKKMQRMVSDFCCELFRIALDMAAGVFQPKTWQQITQLPFWFEQPKQQAQAQIAQAQAQAAAFQAAQAQAQQGGPPVQAPPPQPPPLDPQRALYLQYPSWEQITQALADEVTRSYHVDIETNSTVDLEATEDKQDIAEFMNAFGQAMAGLKPLAEQGILDPELVKQMLLEISKRYRFGRSFEMAIESMKAPQGGDQGQAAAAAAAQLATVKAQAAEQLLTKEQDITKLMQEVERLKTLITGKDDEVKRLKDAAALEVTNAKNAATLELNSARADFAGKIRAKDLSTAEQQIQRAVERGVATLQQHISKIEKAVLALQGAKQSLQHEKQAVQAAKKAPAPTGASK